MNLSNRLKKLQKNSGVGQVKYLLSNGEIATIRRDEQLDAFTEAIHGKGTRRAFVMLSAKAIDDAGRNGKLHILAQATTGQGPYGDVEDPRTARVIEFDS